MHRIGAAIALAVRRARRTAAVRGRPLAAALAIAVLGPLAAAGASHATATVQSFQFVSAFSEPRDDSATCLGPGAIGTMSGTDTVIGQFTDTYPPRPGFHVHGTDTVDYRVDYVDGRYLAGSALIRFDFNDNPLQPRTTSTEVHWDQTTLYDADRQPLGPVTIFAVFHTTFSDTNGNFEPDPGEITADVAQVRFDCP